MAWTTGQSLELMEASSRRPKPGMENTCSTTMLLATISAMVWARKVTTGGRAFFRA